MTTEFRRNVPKKWSLRCSKTGWNKNQTDITVMLFDNFVKLYPRGATGNHGKRWSTTHLSARFAKGSNENSRLPFHGIHRSDYRSTRFEMENLTDQSGKANISKEEHKETTSLIVTS